MKKPQDSSKAYNDYFKDGVPDWDEREEEFNEDEDIEEEENAEDKSKSNIPADDDFTSGINLNKNKYNRDNLNIDERKK